MRTIGTSFRQPGYLLREILGFASPPRGGFALSRRQSAGACENDPNSLEASSLYVTWPFFSMPMQARLYARWLFVGANLAELRKGEVRRTRLLRTLVNRANRGRLVPPLQRRSVGYLRFVRCWVSKVRTGTDARRPFTDPSPPLGGSGPG